MTTMVSVDGSLFDMLICSSIQLSTLMDNVPVQVVKVVNVYNAKFPRCHDDRSTSYPPGRRRSPLSPAEIGIVNRRRLHEQVRTLRDLKGNDMGYISHGLCKARRELLLVDYA